MSGVNKVILIGNLGKDPETNQTPAGISVTKFPIATSETYKDQKSGEKKEIVEWHNLVLWRGLSEISSKYLKKGDKVYIEGKMRTRSWEKDGITRYTTEVVVDSMTMLTPKGSGGASTNGQAAGPANQVNHPEMIVQEKDGGDDLPF